MGFDSVPMGLIRGTHGTSNRNWRQNQQKIEFWALLTPLTNKLFFVNDPFNFKFKEDEQIDVWSTNSSASEFLLRAFHLHDIKDFPILKMVEMGGGGGRPI